MNKEKFKTKKEAITFDAALPANVRSQIYKGHRSVVVKWEVMEVENKLVGEPKHDNELNADGKPRMSKEELDKQIIELNKDGRKIPAVKLARIELCCGLREGLNYCNKVWGNT